MWCMGCCAGRAKIGGGGGGSGGLRGVLTANPIGPMGLPNCSLLGNMMIVAFWITVFGVNCLSNLDKSWRIIKMHNDQRHDMKLANQS